MSKLMFEDLLVYRVHYTSLRSHYTAFFNLSFVGCSDLPVYLLAY